MYRLFTFPKDYWSLSSREKAEMRKIYLDMGYPKVDIVPAELLGYTEILVELPTLRL